MATIHALIIEDEQYSGEVLGNLLTRLGVQCYTIFDIQNLKTILQETPLDVVFLDLELANISGYDVHATIRQYLPTTPIIAYSAHTNEKSVTREYGFQGFLSKPLSNEIFPEQFAAIMRGEGVWD